MPPSADKNSNHFADATREQQALAAIATIHRQTHFQSASAELLQAGGPRYEADPANPHGILQVQPDGTRISGRFVARVFVHSDGI